MHLPIFGQCVQISVIPNGLGGLIVCSFMETIAKEYRCPDCDKLLFKGLLIDSEVAIKCRRCRAIKTLKGEAADKFICYKYPCPHRISVQVPAGK